MWTYYFTEAMQKSNGFEPMHQLPEKDDIYFVRAFKVVAPDGTVVKCPLEEREGIATRVVEITPTENWSEYPATGE